MIRKNKIEDAMLLEIGSISGLKIRDAHMATKLSVRSEEEF
jgi:hypothetical protein